MSKLKYCVPSEAGLASAGPAVGRRIARLLGALGDCINRYVCEGQIEQDCFELKIKIIEQLKAEGWRIKAKEHEGYSVLVPKDYLR